MPLYNFRLEAQDGSGHFRQGMIEAGSKQEAKLVLEERERDNAAFQMDEERVAELCSEYGAGSLDDLPVVPPVKTSEEDKAGFRALAVRDRAHLNLHRQSKPYKLVSLKEA